MILSLRALQLNTRQLPGFNMYVSMYLACALIPKFPSFKGALQQTNGAGGVARMIQY